MPLLGNNQADSQPPPGLESKNLTRSSVKLRSQPTKKFNSFPPHQKAKTSQATGLGSVDIQDDFSLIREFLRQQQQKFTSKTVSRLDVVLLHESLDSQLQKRKAKDIGICPIRRELYSKCFDDLIGQVTNHSDERGLLLSRVKYEIEISLSAYKTLYETGVASGIRKFLQAELGKAEMEKRISNLENEIRDLRKELDQAKAKTEAIKMSTDNKHEEEYKKLKGQIEFITEVNEQMKLQLQEIIKPKKLQEGGII